MHPAKILIRLHIFARHPMGDPLLLLWHSNDSDQTVRMHKLI